MQLASTDWICFLDADDYMYPDALNSLYNATSFGCDIVIGSYCRTYDKWGITRTKPINLIPDKLIEGKFNLKDNNLDLDLSFYGKHAIPVLCYGRLINRKLFNVIDYNEMPKIHSFDDTLLNLLLFENLTEVFFIKNRITDYRYGGGTSKIDHKTLSDLNELFKIRNKKINDNFSQNKKKFSDLEFMNTIYYHYFNAILIENWTYEDFEKFLDDNINLDIFKYLNEEFKNYENSRLKLFFSNIFSNRKLVYQHLVEEVGKVKFKRKIQRKIGSVLSKIG